MADEQSSRYSYEALRQSDGGMQYRIRDEKDNRIATCWQEENAQTVVAALNAVRSERGTSEPVAWRYRYGSAGMEWRYVDRREDVNPSPDYEVQPLYER